jgi:hypothetical protein
VLHVGGWVRFFRCKLCGKLFTDEPSVLTHLVSHEECTKVFDGLAARHYSIVYDGRLTYYKCLLCRKYFTIPTAVKLHLLKHEEFQQLLSKYLSRFYEVA